ncbi:putative FmdB family regulatory protein [Nocardioides zeae]|uniref:FmdB family regulatory protein n=1 Tax=Nocardioides zeae TaxID=1457234 RepID=A0ACC6IJQ0_9ACTN|nr:FmdB family zinc ribbon protein [Nocardioides zeae]MDR6173586.1 putative FmdB family regulatory protein [Nocardioides zeae]MDR6210991.1 putative FmdB family regulatory protein [Nocardioides zeae]
MPTYQYACTECGHSFEQVQKFSDDALTACPECHGKLRKLFNAVGVVFKGSGFYRNDSRGTDTSSSSGTSSSSTTTKSDSSSSSSSTTSATSSSSGSSSSNTSSTSSTSASA